MDASGALRLRFTDGNRSISAQLNFLVQTDMYRKRAGTKAPLLYPTELQDLHPDRTRTGDLWIISNPLSSTHLDQEIKLYASYYLVQADMKRHGMLLLYH